MLPTDLDAYLAGFRAPKVTPFTGLGRDRGQRRAGIA